MPEANILYVVTAVVVTGLVLWVGFILKTAKEPWAREVRPVPAAADVPLEPSASEEKKAEDKKDEEKKDEAPAAEAKRDDEKPAEDSSAEEPAKADEEKKDEAKA